NGWVLPEPAGAVSGTDCRAAAPRRVDHDASARVPADGPPPPQDQAPGHVPPGPSPSTETFLTESTPPRATRARSTHRSGPSPALSHRRSASPCPETDITETAMGGIAIAMPPIPSVQLEHFRRCSLVREGGVEPPRPCGHWNLNPARLPIPPPAHLGVCLRAPSCAVGAFRHPEH